MTVYEITYKETGVIEYTHKVTEVTYLLCETLVEVHINLLEMTEKEYLQLIKTNKP